MKVDDCDFSAKPVFENAGWPPETPPGVEVTRVADMYLQETRWVDVGSPTQSVRFETDSGPNDSARCRRVEETMVRQQILRIYCVKTFARSRKKLSRKMVGVGVLAVGVAATIACPILIPVHIAVAVTGALAAGGAAATATGGGILTLPPNKARRDPRTEERGTYECLDPELRTDVRSTAGPWRSCRGTDSTHLECVQHG